MICSTVIQYAMYLKGLHIIDILLKILNNTEWGFNFLFYSSGCRVINDLSLIICKHCRPTKTKLITAE